MLFSVPSTDSGAGITLGMVSLSQEYFQRFFRPIVKECIDWMLSDDKTEYRIFPQ
jgi:hypothetical protein